MRPLNTSQSLSPVVMCFQICGACFCLTDFVNLCFYSYLLLTCFLFVYFSGRIRALERNKLTKKTLELAQQYFLPPYAFQIRVGALYLLYGLYNTQLCQPKQKVSVLGFPSQEGLDIRCFVYLCLLCHQKWVGYFLSLS